MRSDKWLRARAKEIYYRDGKVEVDGNARISRGDDDGAYVEAWVWVPFREAREKAAGTQPRSGRSTRRLV